MHVDVMRTRGSSDQRSPKISTLSGRGNMDAAGCGRLEAMGKPRACRSKMCQVRAQALKLPDTVKSALKETRDQSPKLAELRARIVKISNTAFHLQPCGSARGLFLDRVAAARRITEFTR